MPYIAIASDRLNIKISSLILMATLDNDYLKTNLPNDSELIELAVITLPPLQSPPKTIYISFKNNVHII